MKVFVAGATGALGVRLVAAGHDVVGMTRTPAKQDELRAMGARPAVADALDPDAVARAVAGPEPEVVVHQLTATTSPRRFASGFPPWPAPWARSRPDGSRAGSGASWPARRRPS